MIEHKLAVNTDTRPVKQVLRKQSKEKLEFIVSETDKLLEAGVIKVVPHPTWALMNLYAPKISKPTLHFFVRRAFLNFLKFHV